MPWRSGARTSNMLPTPPDGPLPALKTILQTSPDNPSGDPHGHSHAHEAGEAAGKVIGGGLAVVIGVAILLLVLGPVLWAPVLAGLSAVGRVTIQSNNYWLAAAAGLGAGFLVAFVQFLLLVQKSPLIRYPAVLLFSVVWVGGQWLALKGVVLFGLWISYASMKITPWVPQPLPIPKPWEWALIGVATVIYAGLYLLMLTRFAKGRWAKRWQLIK